MALNRLGVPMDHIDVVHGDTDTVPSGQITGGSRSVQISGASVADASERLVGAEPLAQRQSIHFVRQSMGRAIGKQDAAGAVEHHDAQRDEAQVAHDDARLLLHPAHSREQLRAELTGVDPLDDRNARI